MIISFGALLLSIPVQSFAAQAIVSSFHSYECAGPGDNEARMEECKKYCDSHDMLKTLMAAGYKVTSSRPLTITQRPFKTNRVSFSDNGYCTCRGAEYILER